MPPKELKPKPGLPAPFHPEHHWDTMIMLLVLLVIGGIWQNLRYYFQGGGAIDFYGLWGRFLLWLKAFWPTWQLIAFLLIPLLALWVAYNLYKLRQIEEEEKKIFGGAHETILPETGPIERENPKWVRVLEHLNSNSPAEWRLAVIEADVMLDELLTSCGYHGDSIGDKLKGVEPSDMLTLDAAWEAHKIRNRIAHSGGDFELNEREAKRVILLFESVFREFDII